MLPWWADIWGTLAACFDVRPESSLFGHVLFFAVDVLRFLGLSCAAAPIATQATPPPEVFSRDARSPAGHTSR